MIVGHTVSQRFRLDLAFWSTHQVLPIPSQDVSCSKYSCLLQLTDGDFCQCRRCSSGAPDVLGFHRRHLFTVGLGCHIFYLQMFASCDFLPFFLFYSAFSKTATSTIHTFLCVCLSYWTTVRSGLLYGSYVIWQLWQIVIWQCLFVQFLKVPWLFRLLFLCLVYIIIQERRRPGGPSIYIFPYFCVSLRQEIERIVCIYIWMYVNVFLQPRSQCSQY